jgi:hypothetical protein
MYDANVLIRALNLSGFEVAWFNWRSGEANLRAKLAAPSTAGMLANWLPREGLIKTRHWVSYRKYQFGWILFDSKAGGPIQFSEAELIQHFLPDLTSRETELLFLEPCNPHIRSVPQFQPPRAPEEEEETQLPPPSTFHEMQFL